MLLLALYEVIYLWPLPTIHEAIIEGENGRVMNLMIKLDG